MFVAAALLAWTAGAVGQGWSTAQLLNDPSEAGQDIKSAKIVAARNGGFHAIYAGSQVRYKRYVGGVLKPRQTMPIGNFWANPQLCESTDGRVHVVIEDWVYDGPETRWYRYDVNDATGQLFNGATQLITNSFTTAKHPHIASFGLEPSSNVVMSYFRAGKTAGDTDKDLYWARYDGSAWTPEAPVGSAGNSEYEVFGIARSPLDGTVYRSFTERGVLSMRRFRSGGWWDPEIVLDTVARNGNDMHVRQRLAVNSAGQVMVLWDQDERYWSAIYTPGLGVSSPVMITDRGSWGTSLCAIPGTNTFYTIYSRDASHMVGRRWANGAWGAEEEVSNGLAWNFMVGPDVAAAEDGTLYAAYEFWGSGKPQQYYSIKPAPAATPSGTISGVVRDQFGQGMGGIGVNSSGTAAAFSGSDGSYSLKLPPGVYTLTAAKDFFTGQSISSVGVTLGQTTIRDFTVTAQPPASPTSFTALAGSTFNTLRWTNPSSVQLSATRIVAKLGDYPSSPNDGEILADDVGAPNTLRSIAHIGLTNGVRWYYAAYTFMKEGNHYYAAPLIATAVASVKPDMDHDGDVDQADFGLFQGCYSGAFTPQNDPACQQAKMDSDSDVDQEDTAIFMGCITGPEGYAEVNCAD